MIMMVVISSHPIYIPKASLSKSKDDSKNVHVCDTYYRIWFKRMTMSNEYNNKYNKVTDKKENHKQILRRHSTMIKIIIQT